MPWRKTLITPPATIRDAIQAIDAGNLQICLLIDEKGHLLGTLTDGDVRRALLHGNDTQSSVEPIINSNPESAKAATDNALLLSRMKERKIHQIPLLDDEGKVVGLAHISDLEPPLQTPENIVVLMAGGLGSRLLPLTDSIPKPLVSVGDKPILETILEGFVEQNFKNFYISVNYKAEAIKQHFGNGEKWGAQIHYLEEDKRLGTAGALQLLPTRPKESLLIMNGDLLTRVNYQDLLTYHDEQKTMATMCVRDYDFQVPFGVIDAENHQIKKVDEKPVFRFFVNAGIYVLAPDILDLIPKDEHFDMTNLFDRLIEAGHKAAAFPIHEYWHDVGHAGDLDKAIVDFKKYFN
jgi:dTDP-glucose pyrophosphorylase